MCGRATYAWVECSVVLTLSVTYEGIALACKRDALICEKFFAHTILMSVTMKNTATTQTVVRKESLVFAECRTTSNLSSGRRPPNLRRAKQMVVSWRSTLFSMMKSVVSLPRFVTQALTPFLGNLVIFSLIHGPFGPGLLSTRTQVFSRRGRAAAVAM